MTCIVHAACIDLSLPVPRAAPIHSHGPIQNRKTLFSRGKKSKDSFQGRDDDPCIIDHRPGWRDLLMKPVASCFAALLDRRRLYPRISRDR
jgi:hypothetical protein